MSLVTMVVGYLLGVAVMALIVLLAGIDESWADKLPEETPRKKMQITMCIVWALTWPYQLIVMVAAGAASMRSKK